jgi:DNA repair protein RecO (recombination protein O)
MAISNRLVYDEAYLLHSYPFSESSLILELLTFQHGRVIVLGKGVKKPTSSFRPVLLPLQRIRVGFSKPKVNPHAMATLKSVQWIGNTIMPNGFKLLLGQYLNELLLRLLGLEDPHNQLFTYYSDCLQALEKINEKKSTYLLRTFELLLLREIGYLPHLNWDGCLQQSLVSDNHYTLDPQTGLKETISPYNGLSGIHWTQLNQALESQHPLKNLLSAVTDVPVQTLRVQLRHLLDYHLHGVAIRTSRFIRELQNL